MPKIEKTRLSSANPDEFARALSRIYCPHTTAFRRAVGAAPATLEIRHAGPQPVVELRYGAPVKVDAGDFPRLMLMQTCLEGTGAAYQQGVRVALRKGETMPLSAGLSTQLEFDARFAQRSVRLDIERLEQQCARLLNRPVDRPLRFELSPFSEPLERAWSEAVGLVTTYAHMNLTLPAAAAASLDEFLISLVLSQHPHNFSADLTARTRSLPPRLVREAEQLMSTADSTMTVSKIAARLRVSLRSLEAGFQEHCHTTPLQRLREIRLNRVRQTLLTPQASTSVTTAALECGFVHLPRFSGYYKAAFGESPVQTLKRTRASS